MIKIRYACLPEGLHATAVSRGRNTSIYLRPGLRPAQRRDAMARLRRNARLGYAPPLPAAGVAWALAADRLRRTVRDLLGAVQYHPLGTLGVAGVLAGAAVSYMTLMAVPLPAGNPVPGVSLPAPGSGEPAADGQPGSAGLPASALVPLGMKPRPWTVPEARPRHRRAGQGQYAWRPGPHPPARGGPHRHSGWWWPRRPSARQEWPSPPARGAHRWPSRRWQGGHRRDGHRRDGHGWPPRPGQGGRWQGGHWQGGHGWPPHHWRGGPQARPWPGGWRQPRPAGPPWGATGSQWW